MARTYTPLYAKPFVWVDTETTGLDPDVNDIIEVAILRLNPDGIEWVIHSKVKMERPENAHPKALEVNGYTEEAWADAEDPKVFWQKVADCGILDEAIVAGQNVRFDAGFLNATFKRHGIKTRMDYHLYDTCTLTLEHLLPWMESISLVPTCVALGIPVKNAHTALADCRLAMEVDKVLRQAKGKDREAWSKVVPGRLLAWRMAGKPNEWPL